MKKRLYLFIATLLLTLVSAQAATTEVWSGSFDPSNWSQELTVNKFSRLKVGDQVVFKGTTSGTAKIQIVKADWSSYITTQYTNCDDFTGEYTVTIDDNNLGIFQGGIKVKGENFTLTSIERIYSDDDVVTTPEGPELWTGSFDPNWWKSSLWLDGALFGNVKVGDKVTFKCTANSNAQIQIANEDFSSFITTQHDNCADITGDYTITVDATTLAFLKNGVNVKGQNYTLTSVEITSASSDDKGETGDDDKGNTGGDDKGNTGDNTGSDVQVPEGNVLWTGSFFAGYDWNNDADKVLYLDHVLFTNVKVGDKLSFKGTVSGQSQIQIADSSFTYYITKNQYNCVDFAGTYNVTVTEDILKILQIGVKLKGKNFTLTSVERIPGEEKTGDDDVIIANGAFQCKGSKLLDANGNEFIMRGINYSWAWQAYNGDGNTADDVIPAVKRQGANCIRIQLADGQHYGWFEPTHDQLAELIDLCEKNKLVAIFNTHDETGDNSVDKLEGAVKFWLKHKDLLNAHKNTVIVNISNEWYGTWNSEGWCTGYEQVIPELREGGLENTLMVDCAGYGQYVASLYQQDANGKAYGERVCDADKDHNTMLSIHFYEDAAPDAATVKSALDQSCALGLPILVGEFGYNRGGKDIAYQAIMDYCQENKIGYIAWSWTGNSGGDATLDMFSGYDDSNMLANGKAIILGTNGIKETSVECSVFDPSASNTSITLTVGEAGYATLYIGDRALVVPAGAQAITYSVVDGALKQNKIYAAGQVIPAGEAVVIKAEAGKYTFNVTTTAGTKDADNMLIGYDEATTPAEAGYLYYRLSQHDGVTGFYWGAEDGAAFEVKAHKACLRVPATVAQAAKGWALDGTTTGINAIQNSKFTIQNEVGYNLQGQRVGKNYRGIVIVNGKKVIK